MSELLRLELVHKNFGCARLESKALIFLVEDSLLVRDIVARSLEEEGCEVVSVGSVREFDQRFPLLNPDVILLDLMLPDGDGIQLLKNIRQETDVPVIVISGRNQLADKIMCLELGADDYLVKPLEIYEFAARVKAQARRYRHIRNFSVLHSEERVSFGDWILDRKQFQVFNANGVSANLTIKEFRLLEVFLSAPDRVLTREQILNRARAGEYDISDRAVDVQITRIRKKLGDTADRPAIIRAVRGVGYAFVPEKRVFA